MPITFAQFLSQIANALRDENGLDLAYMLRPTNPHGKDLVKEFRNPTRQSMSRHEGVIENPWDEIAIEYVLVTTHVAKKRYAEAFKEHTQLVNLFLRFFATNSGWTLPALFAILRDLRDLAFDSECMEEAARIISKAFSSCITDRTSSHAMSRKWGVYYVVGLIMKSYFRIRRISLSKNILRAIEANPDIPPLSQFPKAHQVTYRYYLGMLSFLNEDYTKSEEELTLAFYNCHVDARNNRERILTYLIPLRILRGHLPSRELLDKFPVLDELYTPFIEAIRRGAIKSFDTALDKWERRLVDLNLWLTLEKGRELCIRGLFRRVWVASQKSNRIPVALFHSALNISGMEASPEEAECLVANMIYKGYMKGYISHEKQMVVLSNMNAFPRLVERQTPFALY
ncbi:hypothetical protein HETIRDRAFT_415809 [Heterobasidion irregulare TC 32-1]|uniref:PCI domain-containing protein n=1 Tax=Heterobasidion irregulare (strain TC 32-1) TaxID=747525 RepID=W4KG96_HETIT|nr:uncharacterized protein HETIRDRAFT_415809 [Heterobasidion irregulare TC 32-1]ETW84096.1 hypothetical protein HETIRDRAFT_415809 [Heterobasidion irregulare TC 32-1]